MKLSPLFFASAFGWCLLAGCASQPISTSQLNQARVSVFLKQGETTQGQVLAKYGAPNIITTDSHGREVWTYQQHSVSGYSAGGFVSVNHFFNHDVSANLDGNAYTESSKTLTLTIKFNRSKTVEDFSSVSSSF